MKRVSPDAGCEKDLRFSGGLFFASHSVFISCSALICFGQPAGM